MAAPGTPNSGFPVVMDWTLTWSTVDTNNVLTSQIRKIQIKFVKSLTQQNMDIYRRSRLSEQELEALELREREVNGGQCATRVSWGNCPWLLFVALVPGPRDRRICHIAVTWPSWFM